MELMALYAQDGKKRRKLEIDHDDDIDGIISDEEDDTDGDDDKDDDDYQEDGKEVDVKEVGLGLGTH